MYCSRCGTKAEDGALFCASCGSKLVHNEPAEEEKTVDVKQASNLSEAELDKEETSVAAVAVNKEKKTKWLIAAGIVVVILVIFLILKMTSSQNYLGKMPYDINFGESYEQILKKDPDAGKPTWNDTEDISTHAELDGTFLGLEKDDVTITLHYVLGTNDCLYKIVVVVERTDDSGIPEGELFDILQERMTKLFGEPEPIVIGVQWKDSDDITFDLQLLIEDFVTLSISPQ